MFAFCLNCGARFNVAQQRRLNFNRAPCPLCASTRHEIDQDQGTTQRESVNGPGAARRMAFVVEIPITKHEEVGRVR